MFAYSGRENIELADGVNRKLKWRGVVNVSFGTHRYRRDDIASRIGRGDAIDEVCGNLILGINPGFGLHKVNRDTFDLRRRGAVIGITSVHPENEVALFAGQEVCAGKRRLCVDTVVYLTIHRVYPEQDK